MNTTYSKILTCLTILTTVSFLTTAVAADTTYASKGTKKKSVKMPANLYVPPTTQATPQSIHGLSGQQFVPQINFQGGNSGIQINTPYFQRNDTPNEQPSVQPAENNTYKNYSQPAPDYNLDDQGTVFLEN